MAAIGNNAKEQNVWQKLIEEDYIQDENIFKSLKQSQINDETGFSFLNKRILNKN